MLNGIDITILEVAGIIQLIPDEMLPESMLPDPTFATRNPYGTAALALRQAPRKMRLISRQRVGKSASCSGKVHTAWM